MCLYPKIISNKKYTANKKNGGNIPPVIDGRVLYVPIGCGECIECTAQKAREWQVRLMEEVKNRTNEKFVTLTFSDKNYSKLIDEIRATGSNATGYALDNEIATYAMRHFLERWRKKKKKSLRHWMVTEIGGNRYENIHMHGIVWTDEIELLKEKWQYGFVYIGTYVDESTINYIVKYVNKVDEKHKTYRGKILTSPGIGKRYTTEKFGNVNRNRFNGNKTKEEYITKSGHKLSLPIYYRNKIYTEEEREKLWLNKLDKEKRYVLKQKIDISKNDDEYRRALKSAQKKNKELGFGDGRRDWKEEQYEEERRMMMQQKRVERAYKKNPMKDKSDNYGFIDDINGYEFI